MIPYNIPFISGDEIGYISEAIKSGNLSGNGAFTKKCINYFKERFNFQNNFPTTSCSSALEMAATLCQFSDGDELILPSFGYVTSATVFNGKGAKLVFADSQEDTPHICPQHIASLITEKTKALLIVHYAGIACDMKEILAIVKEHNLILIEDCAQCINAKYQDKYLGSYGHFSTFSFHETKNIQSGEGGLLVVNDISKIEEADQVWKEGTNRTDFENKLVNKYEWVSHGSSYQASELSMAFLYSQLQQLELISHQRTLLWNNYYKNLKELDLDGRVQLPKANSAHNAHIFFLKLSTLKERNALINFLNERDIHAVFHFLPLHLSPFWLRENKEINLPYAEAWSETIVRLPLYHTLEFRQQEEIIDVIFEFFKCQRISI